MPVKLPGFDAAVAVGVLRQSLFKGQGLELKSWHPWRAFTGQEASGLGICKGP